MYNAFIPKGSDQNSYTTNVRYYSPSEISRICRLNSDSAQYPNHDILMRQNENLQHEKRNRRHHANPEDNTKRKMKKEKTKMKEYSEDVTNLAQQRKQKRPDHTRQKFKEFSELNYQDLQYLIGDYNKDKRMNSMKADQIEHTENIKKRRSQSIDQIPTGNTCNPTEQKSFRKTTNRSRSVEKQKGINESQIRNHQQISHGMYYSLNSDVQSPFTPQNDEINYKKKHKNRKRKPKRGDEKNIPNTRSDENIPRAKIMQEHHIKFQRPLDERVTKRHHKNKFCDSPKTPCEKQFNSPCKTELEMMQYFLHQIQDNTGNKPEKDEMKMKSSRDRKKDEFDEEYRAFKKYMKKLRVTNQHQKDSHLSKDNLEPIKIDRDGGVKKYEDFEEIFNRDVKKHHKSRDHRKKHHHHHHSRLSLNILEETPLKPRSRKHEHKNKKLKRSSSEILKLINSSTDERQMRSTTLQGNLDSAIKEKNSLKTKSEANFDLQLTTGKELVYLFQHKELQKHGTKKTEKSKNNLKEFPNSKDMDVFYTSLNLDLTHLPKENKKHDAETLRMKQREEMFQTAMKRDYSPRPKPKRSHSREKELKNDSETKEINCYDVGTSTLLDDNLGKVLGLLKDKMPANKRKNVFHAKKEDPREELIELSNRFQAQKEETVGIIVKGIEPPKKLDPPENRTDCDTEKTRMKKLECKVLSVVAINSNKSKIVENTYAPTEATTSSPRIGEVPSVSDVKSQFNNKRLERFLNYYKSDQKKIEKEECESLKNIKRINKSLKKYLVNKIEDYLKKLQEDNDDSMILLTDVREHSNVKVILPIDLSSHSLIANGHQVLQKPKEPKESFSDIFINYSDINEPEEKPANCIEFAMGDAPKQITASIPKSTKLENVEFPRKTEPQKVYTAESLNSSPFEAINSCPVSPRTGEIQKVDMSFRPLHLNHKNPFSPYNSMYIPQDKIMDEQACSNDGNARSPDQNSTYFRSCSDQEQCSISEYFFPREFKNLQPSPEVSPRERRADRIEHSRIPVFNEDQRNELLWNSLNLCSETNSPNRSFVNERNDEFSDIPKSPIQKRKLEPKFFSTSEEIRESTENVEKMEQFSGNFHEARFQKIIENPHSPRDNFEHQNLSRESEKHSFHTKKTGDNSAEPFSNSKIESRISSIPRRIPRPLKKFQVDSEEQKELEESLQKCFAWKITNPKMTIYTEESSGNYNKNRDANKSTDQITRKSSKNQEDATKKRSNSTRIQGKTSDVIQENNNTSLLLTKNYKLPPGQSSYERRKQYDTRIRKSAKVKKRSLSENSPRKNSPIIHEVRYLIVQNGGNSPVHGQTFPMTIKSEDLSCYSREPEEDSKESLSTEPSCLIKKNQYGSGDISNENPRGNLENNSVEGVDEKTRQVVQPRTKKITVKCLKKLSTKIPRKLKIIAKVKGKKNISNSCQKSKKCHKPTELTKEPDKKLCVFFENKLSLVDDSDYEEGSERKSPVEDYEEAENNSISSNNTVINCSRLPPTTRESSTYTATEKIEPNSTVDSGYLTRSAEVAGSRTTLDSIQIGSNIFKELTTKFSNRKSNIPRYRPRRKNSSSKFCSTGWNPDLIKLRDQLLFPNAYDDLDLTQKVTKDTESLNSFKETLRERIKDDFDSLSQKDTTSMSAKSRSVVSLPSFRVIREEAAGSSNNGDVSSEASPRTNKGGFFNYQKFVSQTTEANYSTIPSEICNEFNYSGIFQDNRLSDIDLASKQINAFKKKSVVELFKQRFSNTKKSSTFMIDNNESLIDFEVQPDKTSNEEFHKMMSLECKKFAKKVRYQTECAKEETKFEEIPLECLLQKKNSNVGSSSNDFQLAPENIETNIKESETLTIKTENGEISTESFKSSTCVQDSNIDMNKTHESKEKRSTCSKFSMDFYPMEKISILEMMKRSDCSNISTISSKTLDIVPSELTKLSEKQFFDNLIAYYDKESEYIKKLMRDNDFFNTLIDAIRNETCIFHEGEGALKKNKKEKRKGILSRIFKWRDKKSSENLCESASINRSLEFAKSLTSAGTVSDCKESISIYKDLEEFEELIPTEKLPPNAEYIQRLALKAKYHLEPLVKATISNRHINDQIKLTGFLKILEMISGGDFTFLKNGNNLTVVEEKLKDHVANMFEKVYRIAHREVNQKNKILDTQKIHLMKVLVTKYHMGMDTHINILAIYIGRGLIVNESQLEDAILYLMGLNNPEINIEQFEKICGIANNTSTMQQENKIN